MDFESTPGQSVGSTSTLEFLQTILPEQNTHFLIYMKEGQGPAHMAYSDLTKMAEAVKGMAGSKSLSVYHACGTYVSPFVEDKATGKREYRVAKNQAQARSYWADLDCGGEKHANGKGYLTQREAVVAIFKFSDTIGWPRPMIVDSGYGVHCYWPLTKNITRDNWVKVAEGLKSTLKHCGVIADPTRTADFASILRPPGAVNRKYGGAKKVVVKCGGTPVHPDKLADALDSYMLQRGVQGFGDSASEALRQGLNEDLTSHLKGAEGQESFDLVRSALLYLDPGMSREQWRTVVWAIRHGLGGTPAALELADQWSKGDLNA